MAEKSKLIDLEGLKEFKTQYDGVVDEKIASAGVGGITDVKLNNVSVVTGGVANLPAYPTESDISNMGFTKNVGTVTGLTLNGTAQTVTNGIIGLSNIATLEDGRVPSSQLPSYVDDVVEYASVSAFPGTGESGKIYVATDTNLTYRWSGTEYVEISPSLALGETSSTAYAGDKGKANADAIANLATVANTGDYSDLINTPTLPTFYYGSDDPSASIGSDGDIYIKYIS